VGRARGDAVAARIGLYGYAALAQLWADEAGPTLPIVNDELSWARRLVVASAISGRHIR